MWHVTGDKVTRVTRDKDRMVAKFARNLICVQRAELGGGAATWRPQQDEILKSIIDMVSEDTDGNFAD